MLRSLVIFTFILVCCVSKTKAQKQDNVLGLSVGDTVPNIRMENIRNYKLTITHLSDFKGRLIILDFWNKWCSSCIRQFPKMEELQNEFGDKIQILLVCSNSELELKSLFEKSPILKNVNLPIIMGDSILNKLFPHSGVPYHVWIDQDGIVRATTNSSSTTFGNIQAFLQDNSIEFPLRIDELDENKKRQPLLTQILQNKKNITWQSYSIITKNNASIPSSWVNVIFDSAMLKKKVVGISLINFTIFDLFKGAFNPNSFDKIIVEVRDSLNFNKYYRPKNLDHISKWEYNNKFCFEIVLPQSFFLTHKDKLKDSTHFDNAARISKIQKCILPEIQRFFNINSTIEERRTNCLILQKTTLFNFDSLKSSGGEMTIEPKKDNFLFLRNMPFISIPTYIEDHLKRIYGERLCPFVINETGYENESIDVDLLINGDIDSLNIQLGKIGLELKNEQRYLRCLVLKELFTE